MAYLKNFLSESMDVIHREGAPGARHVFGGHTSLPGASLPSAATSASTETTRQPSKPGNCPALRLVVAHLVLSRVLAMLHPSCGPCHFAPLMRFAADLVAAAADEEVQVASGVGLLDVLGVETGPASAGGRRRRGPLRTAAL
jgi:hypothetical protein